MSCSVVTATHFISFPSLFQLLQLLISSVFRVFFSCYSYSFHQFSVSCSVVTATHFISFPSLFQLLQLLISSVFRVFFSCYSYSFHQFSVSCSVVTATHFISFPSLFQLLQLATHFIRCSIFVLATFFPSLVLVSLSPRSIFNLLYILAFSTNLFKLFLTLYNTLYFNWEIICLTSQRMLFRISPFNLLSLQKAFPALTFAALTFNVWHKICVQTKRRIYLITRILRGSLFKANLVHSTLIFRVLVNVACKIS